MGNLSLEHFLLRHYDEACSVGVQALNATLDVQGEKDLNTITNMQILAMILYRLKQSD